MILEVNAGPALFLHFAPFCQRPRPVCDANWSISFSNAMDAFLPCLICNSSTEPNTGRMVEQLLLDCGLRIGRSSHDGLHVQGVNLRKGSLANRAGARAVLLCPRRRVWRSWNNPGNRFDTKAWPSTVVGSPFSSNHRLYHMTNMSLLPSLLSAVVGSDGLLLSDPRDITRQRLAAALLPDRLPALTRSTRRRFSSSHQD